MPHSKWGERPLLVVVLAEGQSVDRDELLAYYDGKVASWWLPNCDLSGGSSGGPWIQPLNVSDGGGPVISVNSWGYTTSPGMAGPKLSGTSAECVFNAAASSPFKPEAADGDAGYDVTCP